MTEKPIFEISYEDEQRLRTEYVIINVTWNGQRMSLLDALKAIEEKRQGGDQSMNFSWPQAYKFYQSLERHQNGEQGFALILSLRTKVFYVMVTETGDQVIWQRVKVKWAIQGTKRIGKVVPWNDYPSFAFDKEEYYAALEPIREAYEYEKELIEDDNYEWRVAAVRNYFWNKVTLNTDMIDYASLVRPQHSGPIFEIFWNEKRHRPCDCVKIFVELDGERRSLIDVLKEWETPFTERSGGYFWSTLVTTYEELVVRNRRHPFFRELLVCSGCGEFGCWYIRFQVRETDDLVIWTNFRHPYRNKYSLGGYWDYSHCPPLVFDKQQYYAELETMRPDYERFLAKCAEIEASIEQHKRETENPSPGT